MIRAYHEDGKGLKPAATDHAALRHAPWIDLYQPTEAEMITVASFGVDIPSLSDMEEIELSNRLYHENGVEYLTIVTPGQTESDEQVSGPVTFILTPDRLITVRHHKPRPFDTFPTRADKSGLGTGSADHIFLGLVQEIIGRLADHLEGVGKALDEVARQIYRANGPKPDALQRALVRIGGEGERMGRVRLALLTLGRALNHVEPAINHRAGAKGLTKTIKSQLRDIDALDVHANYLDSRLALASDATLGTIDLSQNTTVKIVSLVSVLFLPPTLIASVYGMNFAAMPELAHPWGYPAALLLMLASAVVTWAVFRWKGWL